MSAKVLIIIEQSPKEISKASLAAVAFGQDYCKRFAAEMSLVVFGEGAAAHSETLCGYGADKVYVGDAASLSPYTAETLVPFLQKVVEISGATVVVAAASALSKDSLPRLAVRLEAGMASEVLAAVGPNLYKRPMWAGNIVATVELSTAKQVLTVRASECGAPESRGSKSAVETVQAAAPSSTKTQVLHFKAVTSHRPDLATAERVVSGGRGVKGPEGFKVVEELADALKAAVGASRAVCDAGWVANDLQVGQTGKIVAPQLYVALGISGAIQHLAGMKGSKTIVAINKDADAPIFQVADYGLVADLFVAVPEWLSIMRHNA